MSILPPIDPPVTHIRRRVRSHRLNRAAIDQILITYGTSAHTDTQKHIFGNEHPLLPKVLFRRAWKGGGGQPSYTMNKTDCVCVCVYVCVVCVLCCACVVLCSVCVMFVLCVCDMCLCVVCVCCVCVLCVCCECVVCVCFVCLCLVCIVLCYVCVCVCCVCVVSVVCVLCFNYIQLVFMTSYVLQVVKFIHQRVINRIATCLKPVMRCLMVV
jgi:hypothetical protein